MKRAEEPDEDGFITVVSRTKAFTTEEEIEAQETLIAAQKKKELKIIPNFYAFTGKRVIEQKNQQLEELRKRFEEDRVKLAALKKAKIFLPDS